MQKLNPRRFCLDRFHCTDNINILCITAINDACLVYDGKLVIDAAFHTNDVSIRGAGTITKFQRKYHADQWTHANFNSKEVGVHVSILILSVQ
jgi:hypothetical protein